MPYADMRGLINQLEAMGDLTRIKQEVDWKYEIGAWTYYMCNLEPPGPALLFENVKDYNSKYTVVTNILGTYGRIALSLGLGAETDRRQLIDFFRERLKGRIKPVVVETGPVQENVHLGVDIDLLEFPVCQWHPRDGGRFIGNWDAVVTRDPDSGRTNVGMYRVQVQGKDKCTIGFMPGQHMGAHFAKKQTRNEPLEVAIVIGAEETVPIVASTAVPYGVDEYDVIGSMRGEPLPLVKCRTVDLEVPATSEIVIEGKLYTDVEHRVPEGPFSEYLGHHGGSVRMRPLMQVTGVMHRNDPILRGTLSGKPRREPAVVSSVQRAAQGLALFDEQGPGGVLAINQAPESGEIITVIQMAPHYVGHSRQVARTWLSNQAGQFSKMVVIVDADVDPFNLGEVFWAMGSRTQGSRDIEVWKYCKTSRSDPSVIKTQGEFTDRVIIDATKKLDYPYEPLYGGHWAPVAVPPKQMLELVDLKWRKQKGQTVPPEDIEKKRHDLFDIQDKKWEAWRKEHYVLSKERIQQEIALSYPRLEKDIFE